MLLPLWATGFAAGIAVAVTSPRPVGLAGIAVALVLAVWRMLRRSPALAIAGVALGLGIGTGLHALPESLDDDDDRLRSVLASVIRGPDLVDARAGRVRLWLGLRALDGQAASGTLSVTAGAGAVRCMFMRASGSSATNGNAPVSIRKRITPNE